MKKITKVLALSLSALALLACDDIVAKPNQVLDSNNHLVNFSNGEQYYENDFEVIYNKLVDSGTSNSTILTELTNLIAKKELVNFYGFTDVELNNIFTNVTNKLAGKEAVAYSDANKAAAEALEEAIAKQVKDKMITKAKSESYSVDKQFQERKLVNELRTSLYKIEDTNGYNEDYLITPDSEYSDIFKCDYTAYIEKTIYPDIYKELLTSIYLYNNEYSSLGRSYAREMKYIKLENIANHSDAVSVLIETYFKAFDQETSSTPTGNFDLNSLANIYKGVTETLNATEEAFINTNKIVTRASTIAEDLEKVVDSNGELLSENDPKRDADLTSTYTGSYSYLPSWGQELKEREIAQLDIVVDDGLVIKSNGASDLPSALRDRLFSSTVNNYTKELRGTTFLTPKSTPNGSDKDTYLTQYAYFDSATNAYYVVIVDSVYNTTILNNNKDSAETKETAMEIARILGKTSTNQKEALIHYLDKYDLEFGDQSFYDYIESTYPDVLEDEISFE